MPPAEQMFRLVAMSRSTTDNNGNMHLSERQPMRNESSTFEQETSVISLMNTGAYLVSAQWRTLVLGW